MNTNATSREAILQACRRIVAEEGVQALSMRRVAEACGIALGTLYNYYADKNALVLATVESIWREIFHAEKRGLPRASFPDCVAELYARIQRGAQAYSGFLRGHSVGIAAARRGEARSAMDGALAHIRAGLLEALRSDPDVPESAFTSGFSREMLVDFVLDNLLLLLVQGRRDCGALLEIIRRAIYGCEKPI